MSIDLAGEEKNKLWMDTKPNDRTIQQSQALDEQYESAERQDVAKC